MKRISGPRVVCIGGGTGISNMLRGLKLHTERICAIVSVADDGGGSGVLRDELDMPPPGDIRNCLEALANTEPTMQKLLSYRFSEGRLKGQSFGNLFLAALNGMCDSFDKAVTLMSEVLAVTGSVLPVSNERIKLIADFEDGASVTGESKISEYKLHAGKNIRRVRLLPESPGALSDSIAAISEADMIIVGPGSLYTSLIPNFLTAGISEAVAESDALKLYVLNIMTQTGETEGYTASDHINALFDHAGRKIFDYCLAQDGAGDTLSGFSHTIIDADAVAKTGVRLIRAPVADVSRPGSHDPKKLALELMNIFREKAETKIYG